MRLKEIQFQNLGSYGNKMQTITYDTNGKLILLQGQSGSGKSTLMQLPSLLFYGKVEKMKLSNVANRINKNGYLKGTIISDHHEYVIERRFAPNSVNVWKDGVDVNSIGVKDAQEFIVNNIVKMPYQIFTNIVSLSMNKFKSFLNMNPEDRRQIIDRVFNMEIVNEVFMLIKKDMRDLGQSINNENGKVFALNNTINNAHKELVKLSEKNNDQNNEEIAANNSIITEQTTVIQTLTEKYQALSQLYAQDNTSYQAIVANIQQLDLAKNLIVQKINLFKQDKCPTCGSSFVGDLYDNVRRDLNEKLAKSDEMIANSSKSRDDLYAHMQQITQACNQINVAISECNKKINAAKARNFAINESLKQSSEFKSIQNIIDENTKALKETQTNLENDQEKMSNLDTLSSLYSVEGVKKEVIKSYLPQLNKEVKHNLEAVDFPYQLEFDENFDNHLSSLGSPIGTDTLSDGEHKRVDLAVLCAIFKLLKRKYPSVNIFTLDEVLSSLDPLNCATVLRFLKKFATELKLNLYVVTHVEMEVELFDELISVSKTQGFSDMEHTVKDENYTT